MHAALRQTLLRRPQGVLSTVRTLHGSGARLDGGASGASRTGPKTTDQHPGYTDASTPVSDEDPSAMPSTNATPSSQAPTASTKAGEPHDGIHDMAKGAKVGGSGAVKAKDRNVKGWGPNSLPAEFNKHEGRRKPVIEGGSNEANEDKKGRDKKKK